MFWLKEYCKRHNLYLRGNKIYEKENLIGEYDPYEEYVFFNNKKYLIRHIAETLMENYKLHGEDND